jgi:hypothetical protein
MLQSRASSSRHLFAWFEARTDPSVLFGFAVAGILFLAVWVFCVSTVLWWIEWTLNDHELGELRPDFVQHMQMSVRDPLRMIAVMAIAVLNEELWFRLLPLSATLVMVNLWNTLRFIIPLVLVFSSVLFGLMHVSNYAETSTYTIVSSLLLQGVMGIVFGLVFLKYTGLRARYVLGATVVSWATHLSWNVLLILTSALFFSEI